MCYLSWEILCSLFLSLATFELFNILQWARHRFKRYKPFSKYPEHISEPFRKMWTRFLFKGNYSNNLELEIKFLFYAWREINIVHNKVFPKLKSNFSHCFLPISSQYSHFHRVVPDGKFFVRTYILQRKPKHD